MPAVLIYSPFFFSLFSHPNPFARKEKLESAEKKKGGGGASAHG
jgi:hypothetical protein